MTEAARRRTKEKAFILPLSSFIFCQGVTVKLEIRGVTKTFQSKNGALAALDAIDLDVQAGEFVCLLGQSG